jgi:YesN/AraC family two-component response regulator
MIKILIVDDSKLARKRTIESIEKADVKYSITAEATDGVEGLAKFQENKPDIVITDIEMPHMNGMELTKKIRKLDMSVEIIVISSIASEQIQQELKIDANTEFIKKPIDVNKLKMLLLRTESKLKRKGHQ